MNAPEPSDQALPTAERARAPAAPTVERPSLRARLLALFLRVFVRPLLVRTQDLVLLRERLRWLDRLLPARGPVTTAARLGGLEIDFFAAPEPRRVLLYLHGGGFCLAPARAHRAFLIRLSLELDAAGVLPHYRLSPESAFPAALDDCARAYEALLERGVAPRSIVVAGDSAGGNLTLALLMRLRDAGVPMPGCAVLLSPGADLADLDVRDSCLRHGPRDALVPPEALPRIVQAYAGGRDPAHAGISPLRGDFAGLVPMHVVASAHESLRDDACNTAAKARAAGLAVELRLWPEMVHAFPLFQGLPEARRARADIVGFVRAHTVPGAPSLREKLT